MLSNFLNVRNFVAVVVTLIFVVSGQAFAAQNVVPTSAAGDGDADISGYTISNVKYTLDTTNPANLSKVAFSIAPTAGGAVPTTVRAKVVSSSTTYATCAVTTGTNWECALSGATAAAADELRVIASQ